MTKILPFAHKPEKPKPKPLSPAGGLKLGIQVKITRVPPEDAG